MASEHDGIGKKFLAMYVGVVTANADPAKVGRVRVRIQGVVEPETDWAFPIGAAGGGAKQRGFYDPPDVGADVCVFFHGGDVERPYYMPGHWGAPGGVPETPGKVGKTVIHGEEIEDVSAADATKVKAYETDRWLLEFDDRAEHAQARLVDKDTGDVIEIDGVKKGVRLKATTALVIESEGQVDIRAPIVTINGRPVFRSAKPIH